MAVVLAAGKGSRMKSSLPKVLHPLAGRPMVAYVIGAVKEAGIGRTILVVGHEGQMVRQSLGDGVEYVEQSVQLGTGHALLETRSALQGWSGDLLVLCGDTPLIRPQTLSSLLQHHRDTAAAATLLACTGESKGGMGRVLRDEGGRVTGIVEEKEASAVQRDIREWNSGVYCFRLPWLWQALAQLPVHSNGEYYLTDVIGMAATRREKVEALVALDSGECLGINSRVELSLAEGVVRQRIRERLMMEGVTLVDPPSTYIDFAVQIGADTVVYPNTHLLGQIRIGQGCRLGPNTIIRDSILGDGCQVLSSVVEGATLEGHVDVGPFSHIRPGVYLETEVHVGNYVELKASRLGRATRVGHFSYIGDAQVGQEVNIGAGTITANYDGQAKHQTIIEDGAFIGSDSVLVAPVKVGARAITGAGSVVTKDVPPGKVAYGVPAQVRRGRSR